MQLIQEYEPEIRRTIRMRLTDPRLRRTLETMDVCQSVLAVFFVRAAAGQFDLNEPRDLIKLLVTMAQNKVCEKARGLHADMRDVRRNLGNAEASLEAMASASASPSSQLAQRELITRVRERLTEAERFLVDQRIDGRSWEELASACGQSVDAVRKQHRRALDRVVQELGLETRPPE